MRRLLIIPIIHSKQDLGSLEKQLDDVKSQSISEATRTASRQGVDAFWRAVHQAFDHLEVDSSMLLYQDALPNSGHPEQLVEYRIVEELANKGSANHLLLKSLIKRGALLMGTESVELLVKEYEAIRKSLAEGLSTNYRENDAVANILEQRDRYIAERINATLAEEQTGVLFIGMLHRVEDHLPSNLSVEYPFGRPHVEWLESMREKM